MFTCLCVTIGTQLLAEWLWVNTSVISNDKPWATAFSKLEFCFLLQCLPFSYPSSSSLFSPSSPPLSLSILPMFLVLLIFLLLPRTNVVSFPQTVPEIRVVTINQQKLTLPTWKLFCCFWEPETRTVSQEISETRSFAAYASKLSPRQYRAHSYCCAFKTCRILFLPLYSRQSNSWASKQPHYQSQTQVGLKSLPTIHYSISIVHLYFQASHHRSLLIVVDVVLYAPELRVISFICLSDRVIVNNGIESNTTIGRFNWL